MFPRIFTTIRRIKRRPHWCLEKAELRLYVLQRMGVGSGFVVSTTRVAEHVQVKGVGLNEREKHEAERA